ncbi:guanylate kinase-like protein [Tomelloso virus]|uniref:Guanylate kinase-like protein n=1 Tax=Tomelloso virus TaxID=2053981 RepID=A0A2H4T2S3_9VIRU|nr:guanylate kinase-like protein [Tomelloso virus]ATY70235.1 guanylate kinase-like protein [Tomelloso virus]
MSWATRLNKLKSDYTLQHDNLDPVFVSGPINICNQIITELSVKCHWADISNISISRLMKQYNGNFNKILDFMRNNRVESKIYKHCEIDLLLIQLANQYATANPQISCSQLDTIYGEVSRLIYGCNSYTIKTVFILNLNLKLYPEASTEHNELLFYNSAALALLSKKHLFPFIEFIVVCDFQPDNEYISHLHKKLKILDPKIKITANFDVTSAVSIIMDFHNTKADLDLDLL